MKIYIFSLLLLIIGVKAAVYNVDCTIPTGQKSAYYERESSLTDGWYPFGTEWSGEDGTLPQTWIKLEITFAEAKNYQQGDILHCNQDISILPFAGKFFYRYV